MDFRIADTFTNSLARLAGNEQKAVKTTAFDLQLNPSNPGMNFHRLNKAKDKNFWSVRVSGDIRLIVHKSETSLLLCYAGHHDKAYDWAERRRLETHPKTGAAQLVEIRETVQEILVPTYVEPPPAATANLPLFAGISDDDLLDLRGATGVAVRRAPRSMRTISCRWPPDYRARPQRPSWNWPLAAIRFRRPPPAPTTNPLDHPDAQRRFRVMRNVEELQRALEFPWDRWSVFLHPEQRQLVERDYTGPARVSGSAGTGKTIVALHRAVFLARSNQNARVLLTTFSHMLANALRTQLRRLISNEPRLAERLEVHELNAAGERLYKPHFGQINLAPPEVVQELLRVASEREENHEFSVRFLLTEWEQVVDAWQLDTWEAYRDVARLGRKTRIPETRRAILWSLFEQVRAGLASRNMITRSTMFTKLAATVAESRNPPFDFAVVDEAQDIGVAHLRFFAGLGRHRPDALFFAGDLGQRIFQQPFSWLALGVDIRGRAKTLRVNYRTSHQIRAQADRLLGPEVSDADGNREERRHAVSCFNGPTPEIRVLSSQEEEVEHVGQWVSGRAKDGVAPNEFGVFVRSAAELGRARLAVQLSGLPFKILDENVETTSGHVSISTMHLAKGLEFRAVVVMACDDEIIPLQERIETVGDDADLQEVYDTERHLLYVACTRARDHLLVTSVVPASEFLDDLRV